MIRIAALVPVLLFAFVARTQDAGLSGRITDNRTGEPLIGASVLYAPGKGATTDVEGRYRIILPAGSHTMTVTMVGYTAKREPVTLAAGEQRVLDIKLDEASAQLDAVVVSAGKFEQRVGEVTQSLSVVKPDLLRNKNIVNLSDALDQVPGVVVVDEEPQIRAGSGFSYGAGSRVQVLVDDIPILSGDIGRPNWSFLPIESMEQVEVIKGASSVLYGSAALSGTINVRTAYPRSTPRTSVTTFAGIYDTPGHAPAKWWDANNPVFGGANFFHSRQFGQLDLVLGGNLFSDAGYVGPEPVPADTIAVDKYRTGPGGYDHRVRFNTGLRWRSKKVTGLSFGVNANAMKSRSTSIFVWGDTDRGLFRPYPGTVTRTLGTQYYIDPFVVYHAPQGMRHSLRTRYHKQIFDNDNGQSNSNGTMHAEYQAQQRFDILGETVVTGGLLVRNVMSNAELYRGGGDGTGNNEATNLAGYVQVDKKLFNERMALSGGVRYEQFTVNDQTAAQPVFRAGATYRVLRGTYVRGSYGQGFRYPTIGERFISTSLGQIRIFPNPDLKAEQSWNVEAGIKQGFKIGSFMGYVDAVVFQQEYDQYVEFTFGQWQTFTLATAQRDMFGMGFKSVNTGGARVRGFEIEATGKGKIGPVGIALLAGYTSTDPVSTTPDHVYAQPADVPIQIIGESTYTNTSHDPSSRTLKFRIARTFRADVQLDHKKVFAGVSVRYNSHVRNIDKAFIDIDAGPPSPDFLLSGITGWMATHRTGDTVVDVRAGLQLTEQVRAAFIVNNLTNLVYALRPLAVEAPRSMQVQLSYSL
jgi:outer membrane receptor protein involved in Fe transport